MTNGSLNSSSTIDLENGVQRGSLMQRRELENSVRKMAMMMMMMTIRPSSSEGGWGASSTSGWQQQQWEEDVSREPLGGTSQAIKKLYNYIIKKGLLRQTSIQSDNQTLNQGGKDQQGQGAPNVKQNTPNVHLFGGGLPA